MIQSLQLILNLCHFGSATLIFLVFRIRNQTTIYPSLSLHRGLPSYRGSLQTSKENIQHFRIGNFLIFFYFCGLFWIRIRLQIHWPGWIGIQSGSETLIFTAVLSHWRWSNVFFIFRFLTRQCVPSWGHSQCGNVNESAPSSEIDSMSQFLCNKSWQLQSRSGRDMVLLETLEGRSSPLLSAEFSELKATLMWWIFVNSHVS